MAHGEVRSDPGGPRRNRACVEAALDRGRRGLRGGSSIARLLASYEIKRNRSALPRLTYKRILAWADAHLARTGQWPNTNSGPIEDAPGELWHSIDNSLRRGFRGLAEGSSLAELLARKRLLPLTLDQVWEWAELHFRRTGQWPNRDSGPIAEALGENWNMVSLAFLQGKRGLPSGLTLAKFLVEQRQRHPVVC